MITLKEKEFTSLANYIKKYYGIDLTEKKVLIEARLSTLLMEKGFRDFASYFEYIFSNPSSSDAKKMISRLTTNHTYFMREPAHFYYYRDHVLPYFDKTLKSKDFRIWSAGCSTGEEPYTLAMLNDEYFAHRKVEWDTEVLATDISVTALEKAKAGIYMAEEIDVLPSVWKSLYFEKINETSYRVVSKCKKDVTFRCFNLMEEVFPFKKKFHVIFCRNVMIYFDMETKNRLVQKFLQYTEPGGFLFVGHSESLGRNQEGYRYVMPSVYRKE